MKVVFEGSMKDIQDIRDRVNLNLDCALAKGAEIITVNELLVGTALAINDSEWCFALTDISKTKAEPVSIITAIEKQAETVKEIEEDFVDKAMEERVYLRDIYNKLCIGQFDDDVADNTWWEPDGNGGIRFHGINDIDPPETWYGLI